jgi:uncharacterized protein (DUF2236 family)
MTASAATGPDLSDDHSDRRGGARAALQRRALAPLRGWVVEVLRRGEGSTIDYAQPLDDPGLFGPDSATWRIHADFPGMMAGGLCALMLQTLHPLALSGVWDHSNFREDLLGRLRRTTAFVAATTFAPSDAARAQIVRVRRLHRRVRGHAPDGRPYAASDPQLLTWVHLTESWSFLAGYRAYNRAVPEALADRYFAETRRIATALGACRVPGSAAAVDRYFAELQPQLEFSARSAEVLAVLDRARLPLPPAVAPLTRALFSGAGAALLPPWARALMHRSGLRQQQDRAAAQALRRLAPLLRHALADGIAAQSCRRVGRSPALLRRWPTQPMADG